QAGDPPRSVRARDVRRPVSDAVRVGVVNVERRPPCAGESSRLHAWPAESSLPHLLAAEPSLPHAIRAGTCALVTSQRPQPAESTIPQAIRAGTCALVTDECSGLTGEGRGPATRQRRGVPYVTSGQTMHTPLAGIFQGLPTVHTVDDFRSFSFSRIAVHIVSVRPR